MPLRRRLPGCSSKLVLDEVEPVAQRVERTAAVVVDQPQVAGPVGQLLCSLDHDLEPRTGVGDPSAQVAQTREDRGVVTEVCSEELDERLVLDARQRGRLGEPRRERGAALIGQRVMGALTGSARLLTRGQVAELGKPLWLGVEMALGRLPEDRLGHRGGYTPHRISGTRPE